MSSLVIELQQDALKPSVKCSELLRKSFLTAKKLGHNEFLQWTQKEQNGYKHNEKVPDYRLIRGSVLGLDGFRKMPLIFDNSKMWNMLSIYMCRTPIAEIEARISNEKSKKISVSFSEDLRYNLCKDYNLIDVTLSVDKISLTKIPENVRNNILDWSSELEKNGIRGEGLSFSDKEKRDAIKMTQITNNFYGDVQNSQIQQGNQIAYQTSCQMNLEEVTKFIKELKSKTNKLELNDKSKNELKSEVEKVEAQLKLPIPKTENIGGYLKSIRAILESATGNATAQVLISVISKILGSA